MSKSVTTARITIPCRFSYLHCWEPQVFAEGDTPKYGVSAIIPKTDSATLKKIMDAVEYVKKNDAAKWGGKVPTGLRLPLRDGDTDRPDDDVYKNCYFLNTTSNKQPQVVDAYLNPITDQKMVYSGCYGKISVTFSGYNHKGNKGITGYLGNIQFLKKGEPLGEVYSADDDFEIEELADVEFDSMLD